MCYKKRYFIIRKISALATIILIAEATIANLDGKEFLEYFNHKIGINSEKIQILRNSSIIIYIGESDFSPGK